LRRRHRPERRAFLVAVLAVDVACRVAIRQVFRGRGRAGGNHQRGARGGAQITASSDSSRGPSVPWPCSALLRLRDGLLGRDPAEHGGRAELGAADVIVEVVSAPWNGEPMTINWNPAPQ
jgi:hypothetical protein